jgi:hypothetical protein
MLARSSYTLVDVLALPNQPAWQNETHRVSLSTTSSKIDRLDTVLVQGDRKSSTLGGNERHFTVVVVILSSTNSAAPVTAALALDTTLPLHDSSGCFTFTLASEKFPHLLW